MCRSLMTKFTVGKQTKLTAREIGWIENCPPYKHTRKLLYSTKALGRKRKIEKLRFIFLIELRSCVFEFYVKV